VLKRLQLFRRSAGDPGDVEESPPRGRAAAKAKMIAEPPMTELDQESASAKPAKARTKATA
jgi:hypothetical protein